jgi:hypothetical protein
MMQAYFLLECFDSVMRSTKGIGWDGQLWYERDRTVKWGW